MSTRSDFPGNQHAEHATTLEVDSSTATIASALLAVAFELRTANLIAARDSEATARAYERLGI